MNEFLQRLYGMIRPQDVQQAATSPLTSPQLGMLNRVLGLSTGQAETALQRMPEQLAQSRAMLESYTPGGRLDPRLMDQFMNLATMAPMGITAWHGSPYLFRQFDPSKVGTGEGAQAYGTGAGYTAEVREIGEAYRDVLASPRNQAMIGKGVYIEPSPMGDGTWRIATSDKMLGGQQIGRTGDPTQGLTDYNFKSIASAVKHAKKKGWLEKDQKIILTEIAEEGKYNPIRSAAEMENPNYNQVIASQQGYLYKGDIPDEILPKFLDWDKKLSEQTKEVKEAIQKYWSDNKVYGDPTKLTGAGIYDSIVAHVFGDAGRAGAQQAASSELEKIGLRGIRYLDQTSRDVGKGTSNFIPFRPEDYKIQEINDIPIEEYIRQGLL